MTHMPTHNQAHTTAIWFRQSLKNKELVHKLEKIKLIVCDVDGTLTDAAIYVTDQGDEWLKFGTFKAFSTASWSTA